MENFKNIIEKYGGVLIYNEEKFTPDGDIRMVSVDIAEPQPDNTLCILSNGSTIRGCDRAGETCRGQSANQIWYPFIDDEGNGCCTDILTGDTYLDWTKEELEDIRKDSESL